MIQYNIEHISLNKNSSLTSLLSLKGKCAIAGPQEWYIDPMMEQISMTAGPLWPARRERGEIIFSKMGDGEGVHIWSEETSHQIQSKDQDYMQGPVSSCKVQQEMHIAQ